MRVPEPQADDEVAELARTLEEMLHALDARRATETEATLARQRQFVADASHELRTPLTSVLANLELLADALDGEQGEAARSALRSSQRMRRLVADLLLLARADAEREVAARAHRPRPGRRRGRRRARAGRRAATSSTSTPSRAVVAGARDELHRLALNLIENALEHTPARHARARQRCERADGHVVLDRRGRRARACPTELRDRIFERFVRGAGDRGGSFGLGLAIVRAVAESHGGTSPRAEAAGARFVVTLPSRNLRSAEPAFMLGCTMRAARPSVASRRNPCLPRAWTGAWTRPGRVA